MLKLSVIVTFTALLTACFTGNAVTSSKKNTNSWKTVKATPEMLEMARFATRDIQLDSVFKVTEAKVQHILGTCYFLTFQMSSGKNCQAELYRDPYGKLTLLELLQH